MTTFYTALIIVILTYNMVIKNYSVEYSRDIQELFKMHFTDPEYLEELTSALGSPLFTFYIAEEDGELVGVVGVRQVADFLSTYALTDNPIELYVITSKYPRQGIATVLLMHLMSQLRKLGVTEVICYSPETHNESWNFYKQAGFSERGTVHDPDDGYPGMVWQKLVGISNEVSRNIL